MPDITVTVDNEFIDRLAEAIARKSLANAGMTPPAPAPPPPPQADPWDNSIWPSPPETPPPPPVVPPPPPPPPQAPPQQSGTVTVNTPKGAQQWTLDAANAPACECNQPAAFVQGYTNGKPWKRWACAKGAGNDWRSKCGFSQWG